jgi:hypothetical protein
VERYVPAAALLALLALPAAAPAASDRCRQAHTYTIVQTDRVRVFQTASTRRSEERSFACDRKSGRRFQLDRSNSIDPTYMSVDAYPPQIAGRYVAFVVQFGAPDRQNTNLRVIDSRTGKQKPLDYWEDGPELWGFAVRPTGAVAWSGDSGEFAQGPTSTPIYEVKLHVPGHDTRLLDSAPDVDPGSFAVSADSRWVFWRRGGEARLSPFG